MKYSRSFMREAVPVVTDAETSRGHEEAWDPIVVPLSHREFGETFGALDSQLGVD